MVRRNHKGHYFYELRETMLYIYPWSLSSTSNSCDWSKGVIVRVQVQPIGIMWEAVTLLHFLATTDRHRRYQEANSLETSIGCNISTTSFLGNLRRRYYLETLQYIKIYCVTNHIYGHERTNNLTYTFTFMNRADVFYTRISTFFSDAILS